MISNAVKELKTRNAQIASEIAALEAEAEKINQALAALTGVAVTVKAMSGKRRFSAATIAKMRAAQQARWNKIKGQTATTEVAPPAKKKFSATTRAKIAAAVKARWAKIHAEQAKAAKK